MKIIISSAQLVVNGLVQSRRELRTVFRGFRLVFGANHIGVDTQLTQACDVIDMNHVRSPEIGTLPVRNYSRTCIKVPINPKLLFCLNKYMYNSEQNGAKSFDLGQNRNFL